MRLFGYQHWEESKKDINLSFLYTDEVERQLNLTITQHHGAKGKMSYRLTAGTFFTDGKCLAQMGTTGILAVLVLYVSTHDLVLVVIFAALVSVIVPPSVMLTADPH
jgi:hypothetical protein